MRIKSGFSKLDQEKNISESEVICWKLYLKKMFVSKAITETDVKKLYNLPFRIDKIHEQRHVEIFNTIMEMVSDDIKKKHDNTLVKMVREDIAFILDGVIKEDFERDWLFYLFECLNDKLITKEKYNLYKKSIDFSTPLDPVEHRVIQEIVELIRIKLIKRDPDIISVIDNPSFDMLMVANNIEA